MVLLFSGVRIHVWTVMISTSAPARNYCSIYNSLDHYDQGITLSLPVSTLGVKHGVFQKLVKLGRDFRHKNMQKNLHAQIVEKYAKARITLKKCWSS
jgi:hypothetical protein